VSARRPTAARLEGAGGPYADRIAKAPAIERPVARNSRRFISITLGIRRHRRSRLSGCVLRVRAIRLNEATHMGAGSQSGYAIAACGIFASHRRAPTHRAILISASRD